MKVIVVLLIAVILTTGCMVAETQCIPITPEAKYTDGNGLYVVIVDGKPIPVFTVDTYNEVQINKTQNVMLSVSFNQRTFISRVCK